MIEPQPVCVFPHGRRVHAALWRARHFFSWTSFSSLCPSLWRLSMRRLAMRRNSLLLCVLLGVAPGMYAADRAATEAQLQELRTRIEQLKKDQERKREDESEARRELAAAEAAIGDAQRILRETRKQLGGARQRLQHLDRERAENETQRRRAVAALGQQVRAQFRSGRHEPLKFLLAQEQPAELGRMMHFYQRLQQARLSEVQTLASALANLARIESERLAEVSALQKLEAQQKREADGLLVLRKERAGALAQVSAELRNDEQRLAQLLRDEKELGNVLAAIEQAAEKVSFPKGTAFAQLKGKLAWPARGKVLQQFGDSRHDGRLRWNGVLIDGREGQDVAAVYHGRIVFADWLRGFGLMVIVDHGDGYMSLYGHNQSLNKRVGDWVEAGESVATVGNSGGLQKAALYFEIRHKGRAVDPRPWFKRG